jgi:hypothetical protein
MTNYENDGILEFLQEFQDAMVELDTAIIDFGYMLEDTEVAQAVDDYRESRSAIKKVLRRVARENDLTIVEDMLG